MTTALLAIHTPLSKDYRGFFESAFKQLPANCHTCDILVTQPFHTSSQLGLVLLGIYSQLRDIAANSGFGHDLSITVLTNPIELSYLLRFVVAGEPVNVGSSVTQIQTDLPELNEETEEKITSNDELSQSGTRSGDLEESSKPVNAGAFCSSLGHKSVKCVAVGGTFDHLHDGHKIILLLTAFCAEKRIIVGITGEELLKQKKFKEYLEPLELRVESVCHFLQKVLLPGQRFEIYQINDVCGPTGYIEEIDALVISQETRLGAAFVNKIRAEKNYRQLTVICANVVGGNGNAENNWKGKLSSTDIREQEAKRRRLEDSK